MHSFSSDYRARLRTRRYATEALSPPPLSSHLISVSATDGTRLRVQTYGPADGNVVVLVHGWSCCLEYWHPQINAFARDYRVVAYDQRGHGGSEFGHSALSTDLLADDLSAVLAATLHPGQRAVIVGHSMGGMTVLAWAQRHPDQLTSHAAALVLTNTAAGDLVPESTLIPVGPTRVRVPRWLGRLFLGSPILVPPISPMRWVFRHHIMSSTVSEEMVDFGMSIVRSCPVLVRARFGAMLANLDLRRSPAYLTVPTTVIAGSADRMTPPRQARRITAMLARNGMLAGFVTLPTGHLGNLEAYREFNAELGRVLAATYSRDQRPEHVVPPGGSAGAA